MITLKQLRKGMKKAGYTKEYIEWERKVIKENIKLIDSILEKRGDMMAIKKMVEMTEWEHSELICRGCLNETFRVEVDENYCEAGPCLMLFCRKCGKEMDFGLRDEQVKTGAIERLIREMQKLKKK